MNDSPLIDASSDPTRSLRRQVYALLIVVGTGLMLGRIAAVDSIDLHEIQRQKIEAIQPTLNAKRQRLFDQGAAPDRIKEELQRTSDALWRDALIARPFLSANDRSRWCTIRALVEPEMRVEGAPYAIDRIIQDRKWDTIDKVYHDGHYYSSKPTLLPTLLAGEYWLINQVTARTLGPGPYAEPYVVGRFMLMTINVIPLVILFVLLARLVERFGKGDWGRVFVMASAVFGTCLSSFAIVLNNHLPGAVSAMIALDAGIRIGIDHDRRLRWFALAGLFGAFTAANELPAAAFLGVLSLTLLIRSPWRTILAYCPAAAVVVVAFFATNWIAHESLRPPYMHRGTINEADNWYDYEGSVWNDRQGRNKGEPSRATYAMHVLVGHHGIFSLTPIWLLTVVGLGMWIARRDDPSLRTLAALIATVSLVCLIFYLLRPQDDRNYGGMTCVFRWMLWFAPMWLLSMLPAAEWLGKRRWGRALAGFLLAMSALSAAYPTWNPWTDPWIADYLHYIQWITL